MSEGMFAKSSDDAVRPTALDHFIGQDGPKETIQACLDATRITGQAPPHMLFTGPPGLGKTTLAEIMAAELRTQCHRLAGPNIDSDDPLIDVLDVIKEGDVLFIDEIHRMATMAEEFLYPAMERFQLWVTAGPGRNAGHYVLPPFTVIGASAREGLLSKPFMTRFALPISLEFYPVEQLAEIVLESARLLHMRIGAGVPTLIAAAARGTPRIANNLLRFAAIVAASRGGTLTRDLARRALKMRRIDARGLHPKDRALLGLLVGSDIPMGLKTLAAAMSEEPPTIEDSIEPYLLRAGYIHKTPRGRIATEKAVTALMPEAADEPQRKQVDALGMRKAVARL